MPVAADSQAARGFPARDRKDLSDPFLSREGYQCGARGYPRSRPVSSTARVADDENPRAGRPAPAIMGSAGLFGPGAVGRPGAAGVAEGLEDLSPQKEADHDDGPHEDQEESQGRASLVYQSFP